MVVVDKPSGMTSHDVVGRMRRIAKTRKIGHAGTLDPMATGVLVLGVERATKLLGHLTLTAKTYVATIRLGYATVTDDREGARLDGGSAADVPLDAVRAGMVALTGSIEQVPSAVSAVKVDGRRAYDRVRSGEEVALAARRVTVSRFDLLAERRPEPELLDLDVIVECSSGTYIRALARDLGRTLGTGGHLTALRRTRVGPFTDRDARTLDELADAADAGEDPVTLDLDRAVNAAFPRRDVDAATATVLGHGGRLSTTGLTGPYGVFGPDGRVVALVVERDGAARPEVVLRPSG
nr:tRNA pseudouridine(55) synthase TruB [Cryptosporangium aurantiacum]